MNLKKIIEREFKRNNYILLGLQPQPGFPQKIEPQLKQCEPDLSSGLSMALKPFLHVLSL